MRVRTVWPLFCVLAVLGCAPVSKPLVGVTCSRSGSGSTLLPTTYTDALCRAGGVPVAIPTVADESQAAAVVAALDGIMFSGGEDVNPAWYGEDVLNQTVEIDYVRDRSDSLLARAALASGKPVLAICRGSQLLNVILGGTLYQDLPSQKGICHSDVVHAISVEPGSFLAGIYGTDSLRVNSMHHQAVKVAAPGITVCSRSADGIVEAWQTPTIWAVQFHPEKMLASGDERWLPLFEAYVKSIIHQ